MKKAICGWKMKCIRYASWCDIMSKCNATCVHCVIKLQSMGYNNFLLFVGHGPTTETQLFWKMGCPHRQIYQVLESIDRNCCSQTPKLYPGPGGQKLHWFIFTLVGWLLMSGRAWVAMARNMTEPYYDIGIISQPTFWLSPNSTSSMGKLSWRIKICLQNINFA